MTSAEVQSKLDSIVEDLQTKGKGQTVNFMFRNPDGTPNILPLSSDSSGVVNAAELSAIQIIVDGLKTGLTTLNTAATPVSAARNQYESARNTHISLINAARNSRAALQNAFDGDANYLAKKTAFESAVSNAAYVSARNAYKDSNVSENIAELTNAKGAYLN